MKPIGFVVITADSSPEPTVWDHFDSVYFLMWPGSQDQLESNRWHWGKRWARRLPVVFVRPELRPGEAARVGSAAPLSNVEILSIEAQPWELTSLLSVGFRQSGQIVSYMTARHHERPLLWCYNPLLIVPYLLVPTSARVFHGTENYFDFTTLSDDWLNIYKYSIEASNLVICCSSGVTRGFAKQTRRNDFVTLTNGCEYSKYSRSTMPTGGWPRRLRDWCRDGRRLAVFAGNINGRLDYDLVLALAQRFPEIGFVYAGPVALDSLSKDQRAVWWKAQHQPNVRVLGRLSPHDLPALYWSCDVGIIPYRSDMPLIVENGFPLKALEMAAAGLPVVSSLMKPLREVAGAVTVAASPAAFCEAMVYHSRRTRSSSSRDAADRICRAYDYERLFDQMITAFSPLLTDATPRPGDFAAFAEWVGVRQFRKSLARLYDLPIVTAPTSAARLRFTLRVARIFGLIPASIKRLVPLAIQKRGRRWLCGNGRGNRHLSSSESGP